MIRAKLDELNYDGDTLLDKFNISQDDNSVIRISRKDNGGIGLKMNENMLDITSVTSIDEKNEDVYGLVFRDYGYTVSDQFDTEPFISFTVTNDFIYDSNKQLNFEVIEKNFENGSDVTHTITLDIETTNVINDILTIDDPVSKFIFADVPNEIFTDDEQIISMLPTNFFLSFGDGNIGTYEVNFQNVGFVTTRRSAILDLSTPSSLLNNALSTDEWRAKITSSSDYSSDYLSYLGFDGSISKDNIWQSAANEQDDYTTTLDDETILTGNWLQMDIGQEVIIDHFKTYQAYEYYSRIKEAEVLTSLTGANERCGNQYIRLAMLLTLGCSMDGIHTI